MLIGVIAAIVGVIVLAWSSDQFVVGAARVAALRRVSPIVVGVVIVGFGTSAPELLVSSLAVIGDDTEVAVGNVVGSNLANLTLLLGLAATIVTLAVSSQTVRREAPLVLLAAVMFSAVVGDGHISRVEGVLLVGSMAVALIVVTRRSTGDQAVGDGVPAVIGDDPRRLGTEALRTGLGLVGTVAAAQLLLWGALRIADEAGLSAGFVGVTLVAVGTSLPELVTVVQCARRAETDLIVGNLLGSNLFNALVVGGAIGVLGGPGIDDRGLTVVAPWATVAVCGLAALAMWTKHRVSRVEGIGLMVLYAAIVPLLS